MKNLQAEMKRYGVTPLDIGNAIGCQERNARKKVSGEIVITFPEALTIRDTFFHGLRLEYLFAFDTQKPAS